MDSCNVDDVLLEMATCFSGSYCHCIRVEKVCWLLVDYSKRLVWRIQLFVGRFSFCLPSCVWTGVRDWNGMNVADGRLQCAT